jgi:type IV pilus assembly protein PilV
MKTSRGFTLIEVLVALVVLSIGLLGVAALQLSSLRMNGSAASRSQATLLAYDVADRMRANKAAALAGNYDIGFSSNPTAGTVAGDDLVRWRTSLTDTLGPTATSEIRRVGAGTATTYVISVRWTDADNDGARTDVLTFSTETQL